MTGLFVLLRFPWLGYPAAPASLGCARNWGVAVAGVMRSGWRSKWVTTQPIVARKPTRLADAVRFIVLIGFVSLFCDMTYEGAGSIVGSYLGMLAAYSGRCDEQVTCAMNATFREIARGYVLARESRHAPGLGRAAS